MIKKILLILGILLFSGCILKDTSYKFDVDCKNEVVPEFIYLSPPPDLNLSIQEWRNGYTGGHHANGWGVQCQPLEDENYLSCSNIVASRQRAEMEFYDIELIGKYEDANDPSKMTIIEAKCFTR